jgi:hypothetical protein
VRGGGGECRKALCSGAGSRISDAFCRCFNLSADLYMNFFQSGFTDLFLQVFLTGLDNNPGTLRYI